MTEQQGTQHRPEIQIPSRLHALCCAAPRPRDSSQGRGPTATDAPSLQTVLPAGHQDLGDHTSAESYFPSPLSLLSEGVRRHSERVFRSAELVKDRLLHGDRYQHGRAIEHAPSSPTARSQALAPRAPLPLCKTDFQTHILPRFADEKRAQRRWTVSHPTVANV